MAGADPDKVSNEAKKRGIDQVGTLGSGNHFAEIDVITAIRHPEAADAFGLRLGQAVVQIHCGSRGLGHQVATDYIQAFQSGQPEIRLRSAGQAARVRAAGLARGPGLSGRHELRRQLRVG